MRTRSLLLANLLVCIPLTIPLTACGDKDDDTWGDDTADDTGDETGDDTGGGIDDCVFGTDQGIVGRVTWREGDWMPGVGSSSGTERPLETTVAAFAVLQESDVSADTSNQEAYGRYDVGATTPISSVQSDATGCFVLEVPEGRYTLMADDSGAWFCNSFSAEGLCIVDVPAGTIESDITIDYMAAY